MLNSADLIIDQNGAPIFCLAQSIPDGKCAIVLEEDAICIEVNGARAVHLSDIEPALLMALSLKREAGICVFEDEHMDIKDLRIERVARIKEH